MVGAVGLAIGVFAGNVSARPEVSAANAFCSGGAIPAGAYASITITGICTMPIGQVTVAGNVTIQPGAGLNAVTRATLTVRGNLSVGEGGVLGLGCSPAVGCSFTTHDRIYKSLLAVDPASLIVHSATIGSVYSAGGSNGVNCDFNPVIQSPNYTTFEDNVITGNATVVNYDSCWFGFIRNSVGGSVLLANNTLADPDAMEVVTNTIFGTLNCYGNSPAPQLGDSGGLPNIVIVAKLGQCASL
jgi:hypothetical protein